MKKRETVVSIYKVQYTLMAHLTRSIGDRSDLIMTFQFCMVMINRSGGLV
jgi:hypothetical protein